MRMNISTKRGQGVAGAGILAVAAWLSFAMTAGAAIEQKFDVLQIGTRTYTNVTVTTKAKNYIFLMHATGLVNVKLSELSPDLRKELGYPETPEKPKSASSVLAAATAKLPRLDIAKIQKIEQAILSSPTAAGAQAVINPTRLYLLVGLLVVGYLIFCYCTMLICQKTGNDPGALAWVPFIQFFPLLRAAGMSYGWFLAYFVPGLNLVAHVIWCVRIARARRAGGLIVLLLLLPLLNLLGLLYLALADSEPPKKPVMSAPQLMTLETA